MQKIRTKTVRKIASTGAAKTRLRTQNRSRGRFRRALFSLVHILRQSMYLCVHRPKNDKLSYRGNHRKKQILKKKARKTRKKKCFSIALSWHIADATRTRNGAREFARIVNCRCILDTRKRVFRTTHSSRYVRPYALCPQQCRFPNARNVRKIRAYRSLSSYPRHAETCFPNNALVTICRAVAAVCRQQCRFPNARARNVREIRSHRNCHSVRATRGNMFTRTPHTSRFVRSYACPRRIRSRPVPAYTRPDPGKKLIKPQTHKRFSTCVRDKSRWRDTAALCAQQKHIEKKHVQKNRLFGRGANNFT